MKKIVTAARYEHSTKTIRSVPENYWLASIDSWDGAVDHERNAKIFAASFQMLEALRIARLGAEDIGPLGARQTVISAIDAAIAKAMGEV